MDDDGDVESVQSANKLDQVTFWTLSIAWTLKLVSIGMTTFALPFNEWIVLTQDQNGRRADAFTAIVPFHSLLFSTNFLHEKCL